MQQGYTDPAMQAGAIGDILRNAAGAAVASLAANLATGNIYAWNAHPHFTLIPRSTHANPPMTVPTGHQSDGAGKLYLALAHTPHGDIPAKAKGNQAWYPYGGQEHTCNNFSWISVPGYSLVPNTNSGAPWNAISGRQNDGAQVWAAIANTSHGQIPAKASGSTAWYPYGGKEHTTSSFSWIVHK